MTVPLKPPAKPSSLIQEWGYDLSSQTLAVRFNGGALYHYGDVTPQTVEAFEKAPSMGTFFGQHIRGKHRHERQPDDELASTEHEGATPD